MKEVWRKSKISTAVVSNKPVDDQVYGSEDVEHYGGYLVAESVAPSRVDLIASAPEMYRAIRAWKRAREDALLEAIKKIGVELPHGGWCFCPDNWIGVNHTSKCDATNSLIREIEGSR
jgi:hypothetical protein